MNVNGIRYEYDEIEGINRPTLYPGQKTKDWEIPEAIATDFHRLNAIIANKYSKEYLKICAFYNKMFPSLKGSDWPRAHILLLHLPGRTRSVLITVLVFLLTSSKRLLTRLHLD